MRSPKAELFKTGLLALLLIPFLLSWATAADSCQPVADAVGKLATTPTHIYSSTKEGSGAAMLTEMVLVNGTVYGKIDSGWMKTNLTPRDMAANEELSKAKNGSCHYLKDEPAGSEPASVYVAESSSGEAKMQVWISKSRGLLLRQEVDSKGSDGGMHMSIRYEYSNVQVPKV